MSKDETKILIVDDDPFVLETISSLLEMWDYKVISCACAREAIEALLKGDIDLVISDIKMPETTGIELLGMIHDLNPEIPVILMTAFADMEVAIDALRKGAFDFIIKPPKLGYLHHAVEKGVEFRRLIAMETNYKIQLEKNRTELELQNKKLRETYRQLEVETAERVRMMEELRVKDRMLMQQSRMAAMGEMLGNIAHQWRQPLNVLGLRIQQLGLSYEFGEFSKEFLDDNIGKVMEIVQHLSQTIDDFRNLSMPDKKKMLFRVDQVVTKTVALIEESFKEQRISIEVSTTGEPQINGYPNEFGQVLLNILINARDALQERQTCDARVTVRSWTEEGRSVVTIADNACGIDEEIMGKIFDPYFTTKDLGKGTGVGLFMSKTIIEKNMGGRITAYNAGDGAEFRIEV